MDHPIDLSRRSDSVETRKTPSPYNSSSFNETSPSLENDSPSALQSRKNAILSYKRSDTPTGRYQSSDYILNGHKRDYQTVSYTKQERITPSPPENYHIHHHRYMHETVPSLVNPNPNEIEMSSYFLNALAAQQKLVNGSSSPESEANLPKHSMEKQTRPFKMYTKNSLGLSGPIPTSSDNYEVFRQQMLNHLYPGGDPIINNPKMRRVSHKSYEDSEHSEMDYNGHQEQNDDSASSIQQNESKTEGISRSDSISSGTSTTTRGPVKDGAYFERRRKNNAAAKKSRDRRRMKESELAIRAAYLQRENLELKCELAAIKRQLAQYIIV